MSKKILIGLVILLVIVVLACVFGGQLAPQTANILRTPTPGSAETSTEQAVAAKGVVVPARYARLSFPAGGYLAGLAVNEGETVKAGQLLARLDTADLELAVRAAEARLAQVKAGARAEDIAAAQSSYQAALAQYEKLKAGPTQEEVTIAKGNLDKAFAALKMAQTAYDQVAGMPFIGALPQSLALEQATIDYHTAQAQYNRVLAGPAQADLKVAEANVANAQAQLDKAKAGPRPEEVALAQVDLDRAKLALEREQLLAPFAGTVTGIAAREGETISPGAPMVTLADLSVLRVETTDLDEWGAARVKVGDTVKVTVNAFKDKVLTGKVTAIALQGTTLPTGDVAYTVTIALDRQDPELRWGMTVKVVFGP